MSNVSATPAGDKRVVTATFDTLGGANLAVQKLQGLEKQGLLDVENTVAVSKNAWDKVDFKETSDMSTGQGARIGALVGGVIGLIFPPSILATAALGGAVGAMTAKLRDTGFDDNDIKAMAEGMAPGTSMLVAVVEPQWQDEVEAALNGVATRIGWAVMDQAAVRLVQEQGNAS